MAPILPSILALMAFSGITLSLPTPNAKVGTQAATDAHSIDKRGDAETLSDFTQFWSGGAVKTSAYKDDIEAASPKEVLGKREDDAETLSDFTQFWSGGAVKTSAYKDDIEAASEKDVLGKRDSAETLSDFTQFWSGGAVKTSAYKDDIEAASAKDVLGETA